MALWFVVNAPGLQNAGVMWAEELTDFLKGSSFTQSVVDRRGRPGASAWDDRRRL